MSAYPATCLLGHRLNAFRLNYLEGRIYITVGGAGAQVLVESLTIHDRLNEVPNTLIATVRGTAPVEGQTITVAIGSSHGTVLFSGNVIRVTRVWAAHNPKHVLHHLEAIDPTWRLNAGLFSARYRNQSASAIAADILARAPAGFSSAIAPGLPVLDEISFTNTTIMDAFVQLATRIGGYTRCDYAGRVYLVTDTAGTTPDPVPLTAAHGSVADVALVRDLSQIVTRAVVEGGGGTAIANVAAGAPVIPIDAPGWYTPTGGIVRSGPQRIAYTGVERGGAGAYVGAGVTPTTAPTAALGLGTSAVELGAHSYAYTWVTANGETLPSPAVAVTVGGVAAPAPPMTIGNYSQPGGGLTIGQGYYYALAWNYHPTDYKNLTNCSPVTAAPAFWVCTVDGAGQPYWSYHTSYSGPLDPRATYLLLFRAVGGVWRLVTGIRYAEINTALGRPSDGLSDATMIADPTGHPVYTAATTGTAQAARVTVAGIAPGPTGVTARKLYRTVAGGSALKLHSTIADNTTTTMASYDNTPDAGLGAAAPTVDTGGLVQQTKQVLPGSTVVPVTSVGPFPVPGYALIGNQVIVYTGQNGTALTGVPATGDGALGQAVAWGTPVTVAPLLLGVTGIVWPILKGDAVNVVAIVNDTAAQTALAGLLGGDGVREALLQDGRISITEATARGRALLVNRSAVRATVTHTARDYTTRSGGLLTVDLPAPTDIHGTYRVQDVTIGAFNARGLVAPQFSAASASQWFTFEDLIRQMAHTTPAPATGEE